MNSSQKTVCPRPPRPSLVLCLSLALFSVANARAARIPEPDTVLYGRIVERVGDREFARTRGELIWTLRVTGPGARSLTLSTKLGALDGGRCSFRLNIPHDVLAYDLAQRPGAVALAGAGSRVEHVSVTLDGHALSVVPTAVDGFGIGASRRGGVQRVDLLWSGSSPDTDADGAPDWWEDEQGLDKFDSADRGGQTPTSPGSSTGTPPGGTDPGSLTTFAAWRAAWFTGVSGDLDAFGVGDADQDGVSNLLEYAFDLDPTTSEVAVGSGWPQAYAEGGRFGVSYRPRSGATDLSYSVESSGDLVNWSGLKGESAEVALGAGAAGRTVVVLPGSNLATTSRFFRVIVRRQ